MCVVGRRSEAVLRFEILPPRVTTTLNPSFSFSTTTTPTRIVLGRRRRQRKEKKASRASLRYVVCDKPLYWPTEEPCFVVCVL
jgi:hypothetical protein